MSRLLDSSTRRQLLTCATAGIVGGTAGCLRLTGDEESEETDSQQTTQTASDTGNRTGEVATDIEEGVVVNDVTLREISELPNRLESVVDSEGEFYAEVYNEVIKIGGDGSTRWRKEDIGADYRTAEYQALSTSGLHWGYDTNSDSDSVGAKVVTYDRETGSLQWEFTAEQDGKHGRIAGVERVGDEFLCVGVHDRGGDGEQEPHLYGLDPATGTAQWHTTGLPSDFIQSVVSTNDTPYVIIDSSVYRCNPDSGAVTRILGLEAIFGSATVDGEYLYLRGDPMQKVSLSSEQTLWKKELMGIMSTKPLVTDGRVFVGTDNGYMYSLSPNDGTTQWRNRVVSEVNDIETTPGLVWVGDGGGRVYALSRQTGEIVYHEESENRIDRYVQSDGSRLLISGLPSRLVEVEPSSQ